MEEKIEFSGRIRLRDTGGYLMIPKEKMKELSIGPGSVIEITIKNCPTKDGDYTISNTIQVDGGFYLRKLDLKMIGVVDSDGNIIKTPQVNAIIVAKWSLR